MKKFIKKLAKKSEGFTLVELIVVIAILGILAGVAVPAYSGYLTKAKDAAVITELDAVLTAAEAANATKGGVKKIVVSSDGLTVTCTSAATTDPWATTFESDFGVFMNNTTNSDTDLDGVIVSTKAFVNMAGTYASGAVWRVDASVDANKPAGWSAN